MSWEVEFTHQFEGWWQELSHRQQRALIGKIELLMEFGPNLRFPIRPI